MELWISLWLKAVVYFSLRLGSNLEIRIQRKLCSDTTTLFFVFESQLTKLSAIHRWKLNQLGWISAEPPRLKVTLFFWPSLRFSGHPSGYRGFRLRSTLYTSPNTDNDKGTTSPNTDNDKSVTSNTTEMQPTSVSSSDEIITVKIMKDTLSDLEWSAVTKREILLQLCVRILYQKVTFVSKKDASLGCDRWKYYCEAM